MGRDLQHDHGSKRQRSDRQAHQPHISRAEIRDHKERAEENERRTKVVHNSQETANNSRIHDKQQQIPLLNNAVHGRSANKDKAHLAQLRRLDRQRSDHDPVLGAKEFRTEQKGRNQQTHAADCGQIPDYLCPFQIPKGPAN